MESVIAFVTANWKEMVEVFLAILGAFSVVAKWTPTEVDNKIADYLVKIVHFFGLTK